MRNLCVLSDRSRDIELPGKSAGEHTKLCTDSDTGWLYCSREPCLLACISGSDGQVLWSKDVGAELQQGATVSSLASVPELEALCITASTGELLLLSANGQHLEEVGAISGGIVAAEWSPEGEVLALISGHAQLLLMNKDWEVLAEAELLQTVNQPVPARPLTAEKVPADVRLAPGDGSIAWRGDARYLATNTRIAPGAPRVVRIWDREAGALHAVAGEGRLSDPGSGGARVLLFERNGLQHGGFDLPTPGEVTGLHWSPDSELLAVIWMRSNWHWYLKQEHRYLCATHVAVAWADTPPGAPARLHVLADQGGNRTLERTLTLGFDVDCSARGTAAVVDGARVLLTPLGLAIVPPPLAAVAVALAAPAACVALRDCGGAEVLAAATADGGLCLAPCAREDFWDEEADATDYDHTGFDAAHGTDIEGEEVPVLPALRVQLPGPLADGRPVRALVWAGERTLLAVAAPQPHESAAGLGDCVIILALDWGAGGPNGAAAWADVEEELGVEGRVLRAAAAPGGGALLQLDSGDLLTWSKGAGLARCGAGACFGTACPIMRATPAAALTAPGGGVLPPAVGLTARGSLLAGGLTLVEGATSLAVRAEGPGGAFLLFITRDSQLHTRPFSALAAGAAPEAVPPGNGRYPHRGRERPMGEGKCENLYSDMHAAMRGRGADNGIGAHTRAVEEGARLNRLDLNVLVDHAWPAFLGAAREFVAALGDDQALCDLLAALRPGSVTAPGGLRSVPRAPPSAEDGMRHLLLSVDVERLYRAALGMHDLALAYMVVSHSRRDPGEYLAELARFAAAPEGPLRAHALEAHLGHWPAALRALVAAGDAHADAALQLAKDKGLLRELMAAQPEGCPRRAAAAGALGEVLAAASRPEDAAVALLAAGRPEDALAQYCLAGEWRMALALAGRLGYPPARLRETAQELVDGLAAMGRLGDAAAVAATYLGDVDGAVALLAAAREWRESMRVAYAYGRGDLVETSLAPAAAEAAAAALEAARADEARVAKYLARYAEGGAGEEAALAAHLLALAPAPRRLTEAAQLCELLVLLGHAADAALLQAALSALVAAQGGAAAHMRAHPPPSAQQSEGGPATAKAEAGVQQAEPVAWKWDVLRPVKPP
ncbi:hypothetical protein WJX81_006434 [Elliptochloris bilobata]|uniref:Elongator complex protein 1 n=1 Tax=Elliptochloris bilobata TaxID=381761 RepID=A0AAW1RK61_9CHLO